MSIYLLSFTVMGLAAFFLGLVVPIYLRQPSSLLAYQVLAFVLPLMIVAVYLDQGLPQGFRVLLFALVLLVSAITLLLWLTGRRA